MVAVKLDADGNDQQNMITGRRLPYTKIDGFTLIRAIKSNYIASENDLFFRRRCRSSSNDDLLYPYLDKVHTLNLCGVRRVDIKQVRAEKFATIGLLQQRHRSSIVRFLKRHIQKALCNEVAGATPFEHIDAAFIAWNLAVARNLVTRSIDETEN